MAAIESQVIWAYKGIQQSNIAAPIVNDYLSRKALSKIGYKWEGEDLDDYTASCFLVIASKIAKIEKEEMKRRK